MLFKLDVAELLNHILHLCTCVCGVYKAVNHAGHTRAWTGASEKVDRRKGTSHERKVYARVSPAEPSTLYTVKYASNIDPLS